MSFDTSYTKMQIEDYEQQTDALNFLDQPDIPLLSFSNSHI